MKGARRASRSSDDIKVHQSSVAVTSIKALALGQKIIWSQRADEIPAEDWRFFEELKAMPEFDPPPEVCAPATPRVPHARRTRAAATLLPRAAHSCASLARALRRCASPSTTRRRP